MARSKHSVLSPQSSVLIFLCALAVLIAGGQPVSAQEPWTVLGSLPTGTWNIAPDAADPGSMYALGSAGISRTSDRGASWTVCSPGATMMRLVSPLPGQQGAPQLYATTQTGLRVSTDGCKTWKDVPTQGVNPSAAHVRWLAPYPNNANVLYAGLDGLGGLYRSTDGGATWQGAATGLPPNAWVSALTADPKSPSVIFVGLQYTTREHPTAYVYRSTDGGLTWRSSSLGLHLLPNNGAAVVGLGWSGASLFAATSFDGLYRSTDLGVSWSPATMPRRDNVPADAVNPLPPAITSFAAGTDGALLLGTQQGAYQSLDGGNTWVAYGPSQAQGRPTLLSLDPFSGRVALSAGDRAWGGKMAGGAVSLPQPTNTPAASSTATPPPPPLIATNTPTHTPVPPTATKPPTATTTPTIALVQGAKPSDPVPAGDPTVSDFFKETGHNVSHGFRDYWHNNGGLARFGYPLTEEFVENNVPVQYFERARFEYRDGQVVLGRLGAELTADFKGEAFRPIPFFVSTDDNVYFGPTKHSVSGPFLDFWRANGRIDGVGYPLCESYKPDEDTEIQWFERARLEWHRDLPEGKRIVLGNIGTEALRLRGWIK